MQRKVTAQSRGPNAAETRFIKWTKGQRCCVCSADPAHTEVDHLYGSTYKHNKVQIGHWLVIPLCWSCHRIKTLEGRAAFLRLCGCNPLDRWRVMIKRYGRLPPKQEFDSINSLIKKTDWVGA